MSYSLVGVLWLDGGVYQSYCVTLLHLPTGRTRLRGLGLTDLHNEQKVLLLWLSFCYWIYLWKLKSAEISSNRYSVSFKRFYFMFVSVTSICQSEKTVQLDGKAKYLVLSAFPPKINEICLVLPYGYTNTN